MNTDNSLITKLQRELDYHQDRLKLVFSVVFRKPEKSYRKYLKVERKRGFDRAYKRLSERPKSFGRLKGHLIFGFLKTEARKNAELSLKDLQFHAKKHHLTGLQLKEARHQSSSANLEQEQKRNEDIKRLRDNNSHKTESIMQATK